jgi:hypothetical protein
LTHYTIGEAGSVKLFVFAYRHLDVFGVMLEAIWLEHLYLVVGVIIVGVLDWPGWGVLARCVFRRNLVWKVARQWTSLQHDVALSSHCCLQLSWTNGADVFAAVHILLNRTGHLVTQAVLPLLFIFFITSVAKGGLHLFVVAEVRLVRFVHYDGLLVEQLGVVFGAWKLFEKCDVVFDFGLGVRNVGRLSDVGQLSFPVIVVVPNLVCIGRYLWIFSPALNRLALFLFNLLLLQRVFTAWGQVGVLSPVWMASLLRRRTTAWRRTVGHWDALTSIALPLLFELAVNFDTDFFITWLFWGNLGWI